MLVLQASLPTLGPGALTKREDASMLGTPKENELLQPTNNFYKNYAVECSRIHIGVDVFLFASQYIDVATIGEWGNLEGALHFNFIVSYSLFLLAFFLYLSNRLPPSLHWRLAVLLPWVQRLSP